MIVVMVCGMSPGLDLLSCQIRRAAEPGVGFFENELGSYFDIFETADGHLVEVFLQEGDPRGPGIFSGTWQSECWTNMRIDEETYRGESRMPAEVHFNPFGLDGGTAPDPDLGINLPPGELYGVAIIVEPIGDCGVLCSPLSQLTFEYSVETIAAPRAGDFNYDDEVSFADFLILSDNFGKLNTSWKDGDATLNGKVDFADFLILSANFGAMREPQLAAVPEPSSLALLGVVICGLGRLRKRRGGHDADPFEHGSPQQ